ncbi:MAG: BamA/TamA family outer membrane protein [Bacteroidales bacterium]|nr:BamA/TamA family outer membrane protein [Bacteroidales bacterium]
MYTGSDAVYITDSAKFKDTRVKQITQSVTAFKPNNSLGGKRALPPVGLWVYNYLKPEERKRPGWLYRTFAKEPVLISTVNPEVRCRKLESELFGSGYFHSTVWSEIDPGKRNPQKAGITYYVKPGLPFRYNEISFAPPQDAVDSIISSFKPDLSLHPGDIFDLETVKSETRKITDRLQESGYFYFNQAHIRYTADTLRTPYKIDLMISKIEELPLKAGMKYFIDDLVVKVTGETGVNDTQQSGGTAANYMQQDGETAADDSRQGVGTTAGNLQQVSDTLKYDGISMISQGMRFKPGVFSRSVYFREGDSYSTSRHLQTVAHLNSYGIFKFINLRYTPDPDSLINQLDMLIELTPMQDISLDLEANVVTESTGFSGPGFVATLAHGNLAAGANRLQLKLEGGVEWQWSSKTASTLGTVSYNVGLSSSIIFPKLIAPSFFIHPKRFNLPQTSVTAGFAFLNKIQYYRMVSVNMGFGYQWKKPDKITHKFFPVFINSIDLLATTPEFDTLMSANPYIRKSFEEQFILGMKYDFTYDNSLTDQPNGFYFSASAGSSGNLLDLAKRAFNEESDRPYSILGNVYSQFIKLSADVRYYRNINDISIASRLYGGAGIPYTNSVVMPYVEQFYSGGSNSIRAFVARSLGPGGLVQSEDINPDSLIIDQTGDIKLEGNLEFRFRMTKVLHGALFIDAGNVWLLNADETRPDAEFRFDKFLGQLAVGTGIGLRFDFNFFILRTDVGFPIRRPYKTDGSNWLMSTGDVWKNGVFNLAIGYPF